MNISTVKKLRCPKTGSTLRIEDEQQIDAANVTSGFLIDNSGENRYPIINSIDAPLSAPFKPLTRH